MLDPGLCCLGKQRNKIEIIMKIRINGLARDLRKGLEHEGGSYASRCWSTGNEFEEARKKKPEEMKLRESVGSIQ